MDQWGRGNLETMKPLVTQSEILGTQILDALTDILSIKHTPHRPEQTGRAEKCVHILGPFGDVFTHRRVRCWLPPEPAVRGRWAASPPTQAPGPPKIRQADAVGSQRPLGSERVML